MTDLVIGVVDGYTWDQIKHWSNSLNASGYTGKKALICYNIDGETVKKLVDEGFTIFCFKRNADGSVEYPAPKGSYNVNVDRFFHLFHFLSNLEDAIDHVIFTDVRDVIFKKNPSLLSGSGIIVGSERLTYEQEPWSKNNLTQSFGPYFYDLMKEREIICAGVIIGEFESFKALCLNVSLVASGRNPFPQGGGGPDQSALNIVISHFPWTGIVGTSDRILHAGTSEEAVKAGSGAIGQAFYFDKEGDNIPLIKPTLPYDDYVIIHQWDRVPKLKEEFERKYG